MNVSPRFSSHWCTERALEPNPVYLIQPRPAKPSAGLDQGEGVLPIGT